MRLTPAQLAVHLICGNDPSPRETRSMREQLRDGPEMLGSITGQDFGFDLQKWHDYLKESKDGRYTWNRTRDLPKVMKAALANQEWLDTVNVIENAANHRMHGSGFRNQHQLPPPRDAGRLSIAVILRCYCVEREDNPIKTSLRTIFTVTFFCASVFAFVAAGFADAPELTRLATTLITIVAMTIGAAGTCASVAFDRNGSRRSAERAAIYGFVGFIAFGILIGIALAPRVN